MVYHFNFSKMSKVKKFSQNKISSKTYFMFFFENFIFFELTHKGAQSGLQIQQKAEEPNFCPFLTPVNFEKLKIHRPIFFKFVFTTL